jgi:hypothetical protein
MPPLRDADPADFAGGTGNPLLSGVPALKSVSMFFCIISLFSYQIQENPYASLIVSR